jgi:hypothetical protein
VYLNCLCTCSNVLGVMMLGRVLHELHRKSVALCLYYSDFISHFGDVQGKGRKRGVGRPANLTCDYIRSVRGN